LFFCPLLPSRVIGASRQNLSPSPPFDWLHHRTHPPSPAKPIIRTHHHRHGRFGRLCCQRQLWHSQRQWGTFARPPALIESTGS